MQSIKTRRRALCLIAFSTALSMIGVSDRSQAADTTPIPELTAWTHNMVSFGRKICDGLAPGVKAWVYQADDVYYDGQRVYYQIADYTGDPTWRYCAGLAEAIYRDGYVIPNNYNVAGFNHFTTGLRMDFEKTGDTKSRDAAILMSQRSAFAIDGTPLPWTAGTDASREVAYVLMSYMNAEALGEPRRARFADMLNQALGHIDQWFVSKTAPYVRPFMVGITMQSLIRAYELTGDSRIPAAIATAVNSLWATCWDPNVRAFRYTDRVASDGSGGTEPVPDLNLLIAPAYAWMYLKTGDTTYRDRGDQIFAGGVVNAASWLYMGKQFNQNYAWSPAYVAWRKAATPGVSTIGDTTPPPPVVSEPAPAPTVEPTPTMDSGTSTSTGKCAPGQRRKGRC